MSLALELAVQDVQGIVVAALVRPERIELCTALALGGLTPSVGLVEAAVAARQAGGPGVHVLVRPRSGAFAYDARELDVLLADCRAAADRGVDGVVVGMTTTAGGRVLLDVPGIERVVAAVPDLEVTVHRAVDTVTDPAAAVAALVGTGVRRVLTSGGAATAAEGADTLRDMVEAAAGDLEIMAGGGVTPASVAMLTAAGVDAVHASASVPKAPEVSLRLGSSLEAGRYATTDAALATRLLAAVREPRA